MAGAKARSGGSRPGYGGARPGAGRKPSAKTIFEREFVGPLPLRKTRKRYASDGERAAARKERDRKKYERLAPLLVAARLERAKEACEAVGLEHRKFARKTKYDHFCLQCGAPFSAKLTTAKYCSAVCKNRANNTSERAEEMRKSDAMYRLKQRLRVLVRNSFRRRGYSKGSKTEAILGCSWPDFRAHIERQFLPGMSWDKMGFEIHIDHITTLASAGSSDDLFRLNHFTNLRPLWALDNMRKGARTTYLI